MYSLGTRTRPSATTVLRSSASRCSALAISTGCTSPLNTLAKVPSTMPPRRRSKRCRTPTKTSLPQAGMIVSSGFGHDPGASVDGLLGRVAEWQTRTVQVRVSVRTWGFNSPLAHPSRVTSEGDGGGVLLAHRPGPVPVEHDHVGQGVGAHEVAHEPPELAVGLRRTALAPTQRQPEAVSPYLVDD